MNNPTNEKKPKMTIIFFSGTFDKAFAMLTLATTGASMGMDVKVFFTFWGLSFLKKGRNFAKKNLLQKMMEFCLPKKMTNLPLTTMNMLGAGPIMMKALMKRMGSPGVPELFEMAKDMGVEFLACSTSCGMMGIPEEDMIDEVSAVVGAAAFLKEAKEAEINLFI